jgi:CBS-domain-containing membrane protein
MSRLLDFVHRHEPQGRTLAHLKSGTGALVGMTLVGALAAFTGLPLLLAPFGATAVLLFGQPDSALAQPANVFGGYAIAALVSALMLGLLSPTWWIATIAVGVVIATMLALRVTHPPAGAVPLVAFSTHMHPELLFAVTLGGALCLVLVAVVHHWLPPRHVYPKRRVMAQPEVEPATEG